MLSAASDELGANLGGEVHRERGVLDRGDRLGGVGELAGGELLGGSGRACTWVCSSELIAFGQRAAEAAARGPAPAAPGLGDARRRADEPTEPTLHSLGPSGPIAPEIAGIT